MSTSFAPRKSFAPTHPQNNQGLPQFSATPAVNIPPGTLIPGTIVKVGTYEVRVERFLSEGRQNLFVYNARSVKHEKLIS